MVHLTEVFRQDRGSDIVTAAHRLLEGSLALSKAAESNGDMSQGVEVPKLPDGGILFLQCSGVDECYDTIQDLVTIHIPQQLGLRSAEDIAVLVPQVHARTLARLCSCAHRHTVIRSEVVIQVT